MDAPFTPQTSACAHVCVPWAHPARRSGKSRAPPPYTPDRCPSATIRKLKGDPVVPVLGPLSPFSPIEAPPAIRHRPSGSRTTAVPLTTAARRCVPTYSSPRRLQTEGSSSETRTAKRAHKLRREVAGCKFGALVRAELGDCEPRGVRIGIGIGIRLGPWRLNSAAPPRDGALHGMRSGTPPYRTAEFSRARAALLLFIAAPARPSPVRVALAVLRFEFDSHVSTAAAGLARCETAWCAGGLAATIIATVDSSPATRVLAPVVAPSDVHARWISRAAGWASTDTEICPRRVSHRAMQPLTAARARNAPLSTIAKTPMEIRVACAKGELPPGAAAQALRELNRQCAKSNVNP